MKKRQSKEIKYLKEMPFFDTSLCRNYFWKIYDIVKQRYGIIKIQELNLNGIYENNSNALPRISGVFSNSMIYIEAGFLKDKYKNHSFLEIKALGNPLSLKFFIEDLKLLDKILPNYQDINQT